MWIDRIAALLFKRWPAYHLLPYRRDASLASFMIPVMITYGQQSSSPVPAAAKTQGPAGTSRPPMQVPAGRLAVFSMCRATISLCTSARSATSSSSFRLLRSVASSADVKTTGTASRQTVRSSVVSGRSAACRRRFFPGSPEWRAATWLCLANRGSAGHAAQRADSAGQGGA